MNFSLIKSNAGFGIGFGTSEIPGESMFSLIGMKYAPLKGLYRTLRRVLEESYKTPRRLLEEEEEEEDQASCRFLYRRSITSVHMEAAKISYLLRVL